MSGGAHLSRVQEVQFIEKLHQYLHNFTISNFRTETAVYRREKFKKAFSETLKIIHYRYRKTKWERQSNPNLLMNSNP